MNACSVLLREKAGLECGRSRKSKAGGSGKREDVLSRKQKIRRPRLEGERQDEPTAWRARQLSAGGGEELGQELPPAADAQQAAQG